MRLSALVLAVLAGPAAAQGLGEEIVGLQRARDCSMEAAALVEVFSVMGQSPQEIGAAIDALVASGAATLQAGRVTLGPAACRPEPPLERLPPMPWIEERLAAAPECRMTLAALSDDATAAGVPPAAFDRVLRDLAALGRLDATGSEVRLRADLCGSGATRDRSLDRILSLGRDSYRAVLGMLALERGCRLSLAEPEELRRDLTALAVERLFLGRDLSEEAGEALRLRLSEALDDPGPAYRVGPGEVVARFCLPREPASR